MARLDLDVAVFDPATPFESRRVAPVNLDTWHTDTLVTRAVRERIPDVPEVGQGQVPLSGGASMDAPVLEVGLRLGKIRLPCERVLVVDRGRYELVIGTRTLHRALAMGGGEQGAVLASAEKDNPQALSLELVPLEAPPYLHQVQGFLGALRTLYALLVLARHPEVLQDPTRLEGGGDPADLLTQDHWIRLTWMESAPFWLTLQGPSPPLLRELAGLFRAGATTLLEAEAMRRKPGQARSQFLTRQRSGTMTMMLDEASLLRRRQREAWEEWRKELAARAGFLTDALGEFSGRDLQESLRDRLRQALLDLENARILPVCRQIPRLPPDAVEPEPAPPEP